MKEHEEVYEIGRTMRWYIITRPQYVQAFYRASIKKGLVSPYTGPLDPSLSKHHTIEQSIDGSFNLIWWWDKTSRRPYDLSALTLFLTL